MGVVQVDHIVQIDAGQNGEDEGLEEGHQELQSGQGDDHAQRQGRDREGQQTDAAAQAQKTQRHNEAGDDLQRDVAAAAPPFRRF